VAETARGAKRLVRNAIKEFTYKESRDQVKLCAGLDIGLLEARHRAGRRVKSAIGQILAGESDIAYG